MITYTNEISVEDYMMLRDSAGWPGICTQQVEVGLRNSALIVAAKQGRHTVGMARLISDGGYYCFVVDVIVAPEYQGKGLGREMMNRIISFIRGNMREEHRNYTFLSSADGKEGFYEKMGFHRITGGDNGSGMVMRISLDD